MRDLIELLAEDDVELWSAPKLLRADILEAARTLSSQEARFFVDSFYSMQHFRIQSNNQVDALEKSGEPNRMVSWLGDRFLFLEKSIPRILDAYSQSHEAGFWSRNITGIGPVLAAGLLAHIDIQKAPMVGNIWSFAGLAPEIKWLGVEGGKKLVGKVLDEVNPEPPDGEDEEPDLYAFTASELKEIEDNLPDTDDWEIGQRQLLAISRLTHRKFGNLLRLGKDNDGRVTRSSILKLLAKRPWNARLKVLCFKISDSFVKLSNHPDCLYGELYRGRKEREIEQNANGVFADQATRTLTEKRIDRKTFAFLWYSGSLPSYAPEQYYLLPPERREGFVRAMAVKPGEGVPMLPPAHIQARSQRWAMKIFLAHFHEALYVATYSTLPPKPYVLDRLGHTTEILPPNMELIPGWAELRSRR